MLEYDKFKVQLKERLLEKLGADIEVYFTKIEKNNSTFKEAITIRENGVNGIPCIYLKEMYQNYTQSGDIQRCIRTILEVVEKKRTVDVDKVFGNWDSVKDKILVSLVQTELNQDRLKSIPHIPFLDLAIIFHLVIEDSGSEKATMLIDDSIMKYWDINLEKLWENAMNNLKKEDFLIQNVTEVLAKFLDEEAKKEVTARNQYIMTDKSNFYGASSMLRSDLLSEFAEKLQRDLYIIPSSVHEIILIPDDETPDVKKLRKMLRNMNETNTEVENILSYQVYYFSRKRAEVETTLDIKRVE